MLTVLDTENGTELYFSSVEYAIVATFILAK